MTGLTLNALLRENARCAPDRLAFVCAERRITYAEFQQRAGRLAAALRALGVGEGDRIAWLGQNCHAWFEALAAAGRLGAVLASLNWRLTAAEQSAVLADIEPRVVR